MWRALGARTTSSGPKRVSSRVFLTISLVLLPVLGIALAEHVQELAALSFVPCGLTADNHGLLVTDPGSGSVVRVDSQGAAPYAVGFVGACGIASTDAGDVFISHYDIDDPLGQVTVVSARDAAGSWRGVATAIGDGIHGMAVSAEGLWLATWLHTVKESRDGLVVLLDGDEILREIRIPSRVPQFIAVLPDGTVLVSVWIEDAAGFTGGEVVRIGVDGALEGFGPRVALPAGLAVLGNSVWLADHGADAVIEMDLDGRELSRVALGSPFGLAPVGESTICTTLPAQQRISCFEAAPGMGE